MWSARGLSLVDVVEVGGDADEDDLMARLLDIAVEVVELAAAQGRDPHEVARELAGPPPQPRHLRAVS